MIFWGAFFYSKKLLSFISGISVYDPVNVASKNKSISKQDNDFKGYNILQYFKNLNIFTVLVGETMHGRDEL